MNTKKNISHLFIDTNVLLGFYSFSNDDLTELEKLVEILKTKVVKLYLTQQVVDEFYRNRDSRLAEAFERFKPFGNESCPSFMTSLPQYQEFKKALQSYKETRTSLSDKARDHADNRELTADKLFSRIIENSDVIATDDRSYERANRRARLGNPPGKSSFSIGDQLNWELLLEHVPKKTDLHIITKDSDYASNLKNGRPKVFLADEWIKSKDGTVFLYEQISLFFKAIYPDENFSLDTEKRESIHALISSPNFASTHAAVAQLESYVDFLTDEEAEEVIQGALSNSQVAWIVSDRDVEQFLTKILEKHGAKLSAVLRNRLLHALGSNEAPATEARSAETENGSDVPF